MLKNSPHRLGAVKTPDSSIKKPEEAQKRLKQIGERSPDRPPAGRSAGAAGYRPRRSPASSGPSAIARVWGGGGLGRGGRQEPGKAAGSSGAGNGAGKAAC